MSDECNTEGFLLRYSACEYEHLKKREYQKMKRIEYIEEPFVDRRTASFLAVIEEYEKERHEDDTELE